MVVAEVELGSNYCRLMGYGSAGAVIDSSYFRPAIAVAVVLDSS